MKRCHRITLILVTLILASLSGGAGAAGWVRAAQLPAGLTAMPQLFPVAACGQVGETIGVTGTGFRPNALVQVTWSGLALGTSPAPVQVDPAGRVAFSFIVPNDQAGVHPVQVSDGTLSAQFSFDLGGTCAPATPTGTSSPPPPTATSTATGTSPALAEQPRLSCEPVDAVPGAIIYVRGENFQPGLPFHQLRWDGVVIPWAPAGLTVGDDGRFTLWFAAPSDTYELHTLVADDGQGGLAACYLDLTPRHPTPTWTATPTVTPTPSPTWTPGPPPGITVTPITTPGPAEYCAEIEAAFTRTPLAHGLVSAGLELTNRHRDWAADQLQVGLWQYQPLTFADTGVRAALPALAVGDSTTLPLTFPAPSAGPIWYQVRLVEMATGQVSSCASAWVPLEIQPAEPYPPPLQTPADNDWLKSRHLTLVWGPADVPPGAGTVSDYEVQVLDLAGTELLDESVGPEVTTLTYDLAADYGPGQLAWRVRARNEAGWGLWATAHYFGVDTTPPAVELSLQGTPGQNGWWRSPVTVRVGGTDPLPGAGLKATYLQPGQTPWQQVIPGGEYSLDRAGEHWLRIYGRDQALNRSPVQLEPVKLDWEPPARVRPRFSAEPTASGWYTAPVTLSLTADDVVSGVAARQLRLEGSVWQTDTLVLTTTGQYTVEYQARDEAGNASERYQTTAKLDLTPPHGELALTGPLCQSCEPVRLSVAAGDAASGLSQWLLSLALPEVVTAQQTVQEGATILASGDQSTAEVLLVGGDLPAGQLTLRLSVQDVAGWVTTEERVVTNAPGPIGPTPTPWRQATATPWPSPTPGGRPYATITPLPPSDPGGDDQEERPGLGGSGGNSPPGPPDPSGGYPVGDQVVPALLPVTGDQLDPVIPVPWGGLIVLITTLCSWIWLAVRGRTEAGGETTVDGRRTTWVKRLTDAVVQRIKNVIFKRSSTRAKTI